MSRSRLKHISEIEAGRESINVREPFHLVRDQKRRFIRLEISEPIEILLVNDRTGEVYDEDRAPGYRGSIMNLSAGGVLIECDSPIAEGSLVLIKMTLQDVEVVDRVLGLVKRADADGDKWLIGLEFISREQLRDYLSKAEIEVLPDNVNSFDERVRNVLNKYVYSHRIKRENVF
jgi:hypothetical protein